jgi:hypothetical protein
MRNSQLGIVVLFTALGCMGATFLLASAQKQESSPATSKRNADEIDSLKKARVEKSKRAYELMWQWHREGGPISFEELYQWSSRWLQSELDLSKDLDSQSRALKEHLERMKSIESKAIERSNKGAQRVSDLAACRYFRTQAELWVALGEMKP